EPPRQGHQPVEAGGLLKLRLTIIEPRQEPIAVVQHALGILRGACLVARPQLAAADSLKEQQCAEGQENDRGRMQLERQTWTAETQAEATAESRPPGVVVHP